MSDGERVSLLTEDDPVGSMRLATNVTFGQRAAALSGIAPASSEGGLFDRALSWTHPDITTCSLTRQF
jgi:hypothetical protein